MSSTTHTHELYTYAFYINVYIIKSIIIYNVQLRIFLSNLKYMSMYIHILYPYMYVCIHRYTINFHFKIFRSILKRRVQEKRVTHINCLSESVLWWKEEKKNEVRDPLYVSRKEATNDKGCNWKYTLEHKICVSHIHNSTSGYRFMKTPWGLVNYIKLHSLIFKVMSTLLEGLMNYQLVILYSNYHWLIIFCPFPVAKLSQKA